MRDLHELLDAGVVERNRASRAFFDREAEPLAKACQQMATRFARGGRLLSFGSRHAATDAQHVTVEFVHPVIIGKRALPAFDVSLVYRDLRFLNATRSGDIVMGFAAPDGDADVAAALCAARSQGAFTFALPGRDADYAVSAAHPDCFIHQEVVEVLYHTLWESVHVFLEHETLASDAGKAAFLYPFLADERRDASHLVQTIADSIRAKSRDDEHLRRETVGREGTTMVAAARAIRDRIRSGGTLLLFGNGGSATDANDWALDCMAPPKQYRPIPAISLSSDAATLSAIANDVGSEAVFLRQIVAFGGPRDVALAISTSGGSRNVLSALTEARKRGLLTVALVGYDGGDLVRHQLADYIIVVRSDYIPRIQEVQASVYHLLTDLLAALE